MQLVDGGTLKHRLDQLQAINQKMDVLEAKRTFIQLASSLSYAHENGIIHRDVKPVNVLMDRTGRPILSDFGIAKVLAGTKELTRQGAGVGTPEYMSPEQCQGGPVDGRADIYALGVMLFEALTGRLPFMGDNYPALAHSHIYEAPPHPNAIKLIEYTDPSQVATIPLFICPQCRHFNKSQTRFCTACGFPLNQCRICGAQNPANNRFCFKCGQPLHKHQ